jgi:hypothetical protein
MSYEQGLQIGGALASMGNQFANTMRGQREEARKEEDLELTKAVETDAAKAMKDPKYLETVPEERQLAVMTRLAKAQSDQYRTSREGIELEGKRRGENYARVTDAYQAAKHLYDTGDHISAAHKLAEGYTDLSDGWDAQIVPEDKATNTPMQLMMKHQITGETKQVPITKETVGQGLDYIGRYRDPQVFNAMEDTHKKLGESLILENTMPDKLEIAYDQDNNKVGVIAYLPIKDERNKYAFGKGMKPHLLANGKLQQIDKLPDGWTTQKIEKGKSEIAESQYRGVLAGANERLVPSITDAKQAEALYQKDFAEESREAINTPDPKSTFMAQDGKTYGQAKTGKLVQLPDDMVPAQKVHMLGGATDETGEQTYFAQEDPYKAKVSAIKTGVKSAKGKEKDPIVSVPDPNGGEPIPMKRKQALSELKDISSFLSRSGSRSAADAIAAMANSDGGEIPGKENKISQIVALSKDSSNPEAQQMAQKALALATGLGWMTSGKSKSSSTAKKMFDKYSGGLN